MPSPKPEVDLIWDTHKFPMGLDLGHPPILHPRLGMPHNLGHPQILRGPTAVIAVYLSNV